MSITPFPPRELAKLVLGYLAEEQLLTAYDELLQGSPYLDRLENEHDHVCMTPLRNILAEYRALKIYVGTCKPFTLRRKLLGCANLLEVVKLLVHLVDSNKINCQEQGASRLSCDNVNSKAFSRVQAVCNVCRSLTHTSCACHILSKSDASVEATLLEDLPGHQGRKKHIKVLDKDKSSSSVLSNQQAPLNAKNPEESSTENLDQDVVLVESPTLQRRDNDCNSNGPTNNIHSASRGAPNASQKIDNIHTNLSNVTDSSECNKNVSSGHGGRHSPATGTFQDFAAGIEGKNTEPAPSSCESLNSVIPVTSTVSSNKDSIDSDISYKEGVTKAHILLKVENLKDSTSSSTNGDAINTTITDLHQSHSLRPKPTEQKITILSDIKVDKGFAAGEPGVGVGAGCARAPAVLRHAHTPRALQTVLINGTRAFTRELPAGARAYSRDEIMAMPTIILVPASGAAAATAAGQLHNPNNIYVQATNTETASVPPNNISSTARSLGPLVIDVDTTDCAKNQVKAQTDKSTVKAKKDIISKSKALDSKQCDTVAKAADIKNATVPKDAEASNKSTPVSVPLPRKSSSTPRRSTHVRVLDFTTPRRILSETIPEHPPLALEATTTAQHQVDVIANKTTKHPAQVIVNKTPSLYACANLKDANDSDKSDTINVPKIDSFNKTDECAIATQSIQKIITVKKSDWDADLRALAVAHSKLGTPKSKAKSTRRKKGSENKRDVEKSQEKKNPRRRSSFNKSSTKIKIKSLEVIEDAVEIVQSSASAPVAVKPTINVITDHDWGTIPTVEDHDKNKNDDMEIDTPEMERLSLQNAIGAKLNISDLLETPYKQALYDIQMETPKFLGPDIPGDPMSDIKIMNIPTPRFLDTPQPPQATPTSYSSRQTDYSSGGSYYRPDDQEYIDVGYPEPPPKETSLASDDAGKNKSKEKIVKSSRPVRKCTKNVSYINSPNIKPKEDKVDASVSSESSFNEHAQPTRPLKCKTPKTETKRKSIGIKKRKTPVKRETPKSFMKIKPRRPTPVKDSARKRKQSGTPERKRTVSRDKIVSVTTAVASVPTKSRRKSSTPRKIHCTKQFHSESSGHDSPEAVEVRNVPDSDPEPPLRWSDEGTQDAAPTESTAEIQHVTSTKPTGPVNDTDDITKIQEYLAESETTKAVDEGRESNLHIDLVKRGFDIETAKIIERDLLDTPPYPKENTPTSNVGHLVPEAIKDNKVESDIKEKGESIGSASVNADVEGDEEDEIKFTVYECNEESENYIVCYHNDNKDIPRRAPEKLKDKFSMEICIDDDITIRLRATPLTFLIDENPKDEKRLEYNRVTKMSVRETEMAVRETEMTVRETEMAVRETEMAVRETEIAVNSISGMVKLYTPLKDQRAQCYEIFDSTLTSLDTPLKVDTPRRRDPEMTVTEIVLEVEKVEAKDKVETKMRKRALSGNESDGSTSENKRSKPDPQYLMNPAKIQDIDIESVLSKLHGP